jgi:hypothetical protein
MMANLVIYEWRRLKVRYLLSSVFSVLDGGELALRARQIQPVTFLQSR